MALTPPPPEITGQQNKQPWRPRFAESSQKGARAPFPPTPLSQNVQVKIQKKWFKCVVHIVYHGYLFGFQRKS